MSRIEGKEYKKFFDAYYGVIKENPDFDDQHHEAATFLELLYKECIEVEEFDLLSEKALDKLRQFAWKFWKYGFAYDYPDDEDYKETKD